MPFSDILAQKPEKRLLGLEVTPISQVPQLEVNVVEENEQRGHQWAFWQPRGLGHLITSFLIITS